MTTLEVTVQIGTKIQFVSVLANARFTDLLKRLDLSAHSIVIHQTDNEQIESNRDYIIDYEPTLKFLILANDDVDKGRVRVVYENNDTVRIRTNRDWRVRTLIDSAVGVLGLSGNDDYILSQGDGNNRIGNNLEPYDRLPNYNRTTYYLRRNSNNIVWVSVGAGIILIILLIVIVLACL